MGRVNIAIDGPAGSGKSSVADRIARQDDHIAVCIFFGIGLLHLNEVAIGLGHRVI